MKTKLGSPILRLGVGMLLPLMGCGGADVFELVGTVERKNLELAAPVSEVIVEIPVTRGQRVNAGEVVVRLDTAVAEAELRAGEAAIAAAEAWVAEQTTRFNRFNELRRRKIATPQDYDQAKRGRDEALAGLAERQARLAQATKRLEDLTIRSHAAGVVDQIPFEEGERVPTGGVVAVVQADLAPWVRVWIPARAVARISSEAWAEVEVEGLDEPCRGRLEDVAREPEFTPHYALTERESSHLVYQARILLEDAPPQLRPGLSARVRLILPEASSTSAPGPSGSPQAEVPVKPQTEPSPAQSSQPETDTP
ncbi:MAG: efflux RND transporter periplasmic adaptor subunit [Deltaproteobacteria bacterium]|nr:efflux RND transporter periplasmic adaptor subunit [Deltaproteobacteria bacterium]